jgi:hypothetical protein
MNGPNDTTRDTDKDCNICGATVEIVGNAATQCSNRRCVTRDRDNSLRTDATAADVHEYHESKDVVPKEKLRDEATDAWHRFNYADDAPTSREAYGTIQGICGVLGINLGTVAQWYEEDTI